MTVTSYAAYVWPGGYPLWYLTESGMTICPKCANNPDVHDDAPIAHDVNWEDETLLCDDCGTSIPCAYPED